MTTTATLLQDDGVLTPALLGCLDETGHDWRLLQLVSKKFCGVWRLHKVQVLQWRVAVLEDAAAALEDRIDDITRGCSCGYAVGYHFAR